MLAVGATLDDFTLNDDRDQPVRWSSLRGQPVVIFAYPRADTPGCTREACAFRDLAADFARHGVRVFGLSSDKVAALGRFRDKYGLTMPLLSDPDKQVLRALGAWGTKKMYGKDVEGTLRSTFAFDADGVAWQVWPQVKVDGHADAVLAAVAQRFA